MARVLIGPHVLRDVNGEFRALLRGAGFEIIYPRRPVQMTEDELLDQLHDCEAALAGSEPFTRRVIEAHPKLRVIARAGVGYDSVDIAAATEKGIPVLIAPGNAEGVAEHAFALILALAKGVVAQHNEVVAGHWPRHSNLPLRGTTLAIAGLGRIGKATATKGRAFGMRVIACDPYIDRTFAMTHGIALKSMDEIFAEGDYISVHLPLTAESRHAVDRRLLGMMKKTAFLINTSRGSIINENDLVEALKSGRIAGAGLDVLEEEPPPPGSPILTAPNVVFTAHTAGVDARSRDDMGLIAAKGIVEVMRGGWPEELVVNPGARKKATV